MSENTYKQTKSETRGEGNSGSNKGAGMLGSLLNGSFLARDKSADLLPFVFFLAMLAAMLIANTYYAEKKVRRIEITREEVTELRTLYVSNKTRLMHLSNQSEIARKLHYHGFVESTVPPRYFGGKSSQRSFLLRIFRSN